MPPYYSPSTEYITLFFSLPVVFYLASISTHSRFAASKLCPLPSTKAETETTPPTKTWLDVLKAVGIQCAIFLVVFVGVRKVPANVLDTALLVLIGFGLASTNRAFISQFFGWELVTMAKTSKGAPQIGYIPNTWRTYLLTLLPSLGMFAFCAISNPSLSSLVFIPLSTAFASLPLIGTVSLRQVIFYILLLEFSTIAITGLAVAMFSSDAGQAALSKLGDAVDNGSEPVSPQDHDLTVLELAYVYQSWMLFGMLGNLLALLYRMDRRFAEKQADGTQLNVEVDELERLPPLEVKAGQQPTGERVVLLPLRKVLVHELGSFGDLVRFGYAKLAAGTILVSLAGLTWLFSCVLTEADDFESGPDSRSQGIEFVARSACVFLAPLLISMMVAAVALWRGEFRHVWNYREMWSTEVKAADGTSDEKAALLAEDEA